MNEDILYRDEVFKIIGGCIALHKDKGTGFVEAVYQDALEIEFLHLGIPFASQRNFPIFYRGIQLKHTYTPDLICFDKIILELKSVKKLTDEHRAQLHNYLKITGHQLGLLINFSSYPRLEWERIIRTQ